MSSAFDLYDSLDVIGTGSFGIIRKVRRKSDGLIFARKELNFERMSERDRKQIVSEVNILKDLHHEHIVRYHDRHVDRDAGILYILMEYCGGGDLSTVIKQAQRQGRPIPEDTVWNYFMQILLALNHCHHPNGHGRSGSAASDGENKEKRPQILHRDLKPDNVFLDENNFVKLGDFGLSKALAQASFANTYVGTPYYMSPELMQEKAYDSKSDIWSLGCLIFELCALKPPFHEAKTQAELSILIRNGRIPPLPKGYSPALSSVIKAMLNLNPAMRPSAAQLLGHERLELAFKVSETQKLLTAVKAHKTTLLARERDVVARESAFAEKESAFKTALAQKDAELAALRANAAQAEAAVSVRVREALVRREEELRAMVLKQEADVAARMARREEEIMEAVRRREEEIAQMWAQWEVQTRQNMVNAVEERMTWVQQRTDELEQEHVRLGGVRQELERKMAALEDGVGRKGACSRSTAKTPLEEVRNILAPLARFVDSPERTPIRPPVTDPVFKTPMNRAAAKPVPLPEPDFAPPSAMKGVILTATGEPIATPTPAELAKLFVDTPKVGLDFAKIFDFDSEAGSDSDADEEGYETDTRVPSSQSSSSTATVTASRRSSTGTDDDPTPQPSPAVRPTRLRRPSIRASSQRPSLDVPPADPAPKKHPRAPSAGPSTRLAKTGPTAAAPEYDLSDEENLPSPFLRRPDRERITRTASQPAGSMVARNAPRRSGTTLRAVAVVNAANAAGVAGARGARKGSLKPGEAAAGVRSSIAKAQKASEEARKALFRP
ncbi:kinase-like protein [Amylocystis lapponica]|nr:kinase-like protein [Amylocystis lapponica]